jgi:uncharacterized protein YbjT (DUF2867 family)
MYLVTGPTGNVGSEVVAQLITSGKKVRVFTRNGESVAHWGEQVQVAIGDFAIPDTFSRALDGVESVFLMNGRADGETFKRLVTTAKARGTPRITLLSTLAASMPDSLIGKLHKDMEDAIRESGLPGTFVRPGGFMSNCYQWIKTIRTEGVVHNAMGTGKFAPIAPEDIAAVAVKALTSGNNTEEVFELTGGELLTVPEQVNILAGILGRPIQCIDVSPEIAVQNFIHAGIPAHVATAVGQSFASVRAGKATDVKDTVQRVTGRPPTTFTEWASKNASRFA